MKLNEQLLDKVVGGDNTDGAPGKLSAGRVMLCALCPMTFTYPDEGSGTIICPKCGYPNTYSN